LRRRRIMNPLSSYRLLSLLENVNRGKFPHTPAFCFMPRDGNCGLAG
jgi:hypothetical protein